jgi:hypothetical protein
MKEVTINELIIIIGELDSNTILNILINNEEIKNE